MEFNIEVWLTWRCSTLASYSGDVLHSLDHRLDDFTGRGFFEAALGVAVPSAFSHALHTWCAKHKSRIISCSSEKFTAMTFTPDPLSDAHMTQSFPW